MKQILLLLIVLLLAGCNDNASQTDTATNATSPSSPTTSTTNNEDNIEQQIEDVEQTENIAMKETVKNISKENIATISTLISALERVESYESVKLSEHIVEGRPEDSYRYKETLRYVKQPHETHYIYESHNPVYMEIYANETDGMYVNDDEANPNWTYSLEEDTIAMWQEEPLPDTAELLLQIVDEHSSVDVTNNEFEIVVSMPSTELDALLGGGDSDPPFYMFSTITCNIVANGGFIDRYTIVGDYVTQDDAVGQFIIEEQFANMNNIPHVRVPAAVKDIAILEDMSIEWNE